MKFTSFEWGSYLKILKMDYFYQLKKSRFMNSKLLLLISILLFGLTSFAQELFVSENEEGQWGFVNSDGQEIIAHQYEKADCFYMGYAAVVLKGKMGLIDLQGNMIIPCEYDNDLMYFEGGLAVVKKNEKYGYANLEGNIVIPILYDEAEDCSDGKCHVRMGEQWLYLDKNGKEMKE